TLNGVTISSGSTYTLPNNTTTLLQGTITNNGLIQLNSVGNATDLQIGGSGATVTLTGGGTVNMGNNSQNRIYSAGNGTGTLVNSTGNTIQGAGQIGVGQMNLNNQGTINANLSSGLTINPGGGSQLVTNTGTLEATAGGTLTLQGAFTNTGGLIKAD